MGKKAQTRSKPSVAILLATYQGKDYLAEQLDSFIAQDYSNWKVWASDDGSTDDTVSILRDYQQQYKERFKLLEGPKNGLVANFLSLTCNEAIEADYYAFSDQDDIWLPNKLSRALAWLEQQPADTPALYCSRTQLVDKHNQNKGLSPLFSRQPTFANALVQTIAGGNTMMFNLAARKLVVRAGMNVPTVVHDWWLYALVSGCGGVVHYDPKATVRYRQHDNNLIGSDTSWMAQALSIRRLLQGSFHKRIDRNITALTSAIEMLSPSNRLILETFLNARQKRLAGRVLSLYRSGIYRQTTLGNLGLFVAAITNKL